MSKALTQTEHSRTGFKCVPLQGMDLHGLKETMMTYDECLDTVESVNNTNVVMQGIDYVYKWTSGGAASYGSSLNTEKLEGQTSWEKDGYICRPQDNDPVYSSLMNYDECVARKREPSETSINAYEAESHKFRLAYSPFSEIDKVYKPLEGDSAIDCQSSGGQNECCRCIGEKNGASGLGFGYDDQDRRRLGSRRLGPFLTNDAGSASPLDSTTKAKIVVNVQECFANGKCPAVCSHFKDNDIVGPFTCSKATTNAALPTSHDGAVAYYKKYFAPKELCAPLKKNAPFQCTGSEPKSAAEILSLSYANTQLAFSAFGSLFVMILYKCKKAKNPNFLQEDELLAKLKKLETDNASIMSDNKAMKAAIERLQTLEAGQTENDSQDENTVTSTT